MQSMYNQYGAVTDPINQVIFAGNGTEYYPHEIVHLYTTQFWGEKGNYYHQWFDEGIATLFGGYLGLPLEYHLDKLKSYLNKNHSVEIKDISSLQLEINNDFQTVPMYTIGGLICKLIYEKEGMVGLFDLLKSGSSDDDFYHAIEKHLGVKKSDFGKFIRSELNKIKD